MTDTSKVLLHVDGLRVRLDLEEGSIHPVRDVSCVVHEGETLGIVGESGSGKSVFALSMLGLVPIPPARIEQGRVLFRGRDLLRASPAELRAIRGGEIGFIFQDPMSALNPVLTIGRQIMEPLRRHLKLSRAAARARAVELLDLVGIRDPHRCMDQYIHQLSGGMRQRVMIAIGVSCTPKLLIADEPTTALDVTIQAQILELVQDLKAKLGMAMIWISHDLGVVAGLADTVQVMYAGCVLERGPVDAIFGDPRNAYTLGLLQSMPPRDGTTGHRLTPIRGQPPNPFDLPKGDPFAPRNPFATPRCHVEMPPLVQVADGAEGHLCAAFYDLRTAPRSDDTEAACA
ncbi:MAG: ABC transporter ATP-binding protein [Burkholderiaceae bacterium]